MNEILLKNVPKWIQDSGFYNDLKENHEDETEPIYVPERFSPFIKVNNNDDFIRYIEICKFWCINKLSQFIYNYCIRNSRSLKTNQNFLDCINNFKFKNEILIFISDDVINEIIKKNRCDLLLDFVKNFSYLKCIYIAIEYDNPDSLDSLIMNFDLIITKKLVYEIINHNSHKCLKYLNIELDNIIQYNMFICEKGYLELLEYFHEKGFRFNSRHLCKCIEFDNIECLKYICSLIDIFNRNIVNINHIRSALVIKKNKMKCFKYLCNIGYLDLDYHAMYDSVLSDNIELMLFCIENGLETKKSYISVAIQWNSIKCFTYFVESGMEITRQHIREVMSYDDHRNIYKYLVSIGYISN